LISTPLKKLIITHPSQPANLNGTTAVFHKQNPQHNGLVEVNFYDKHIKGLSHPSLF